MASPFTVKLVPSNIKFDSAIAESVVPSDVRTLLLPGEDILENPVPLEPDVPDVPD